MSAFNVFKRKKPEKKKIEKKEVKKTPEVKGRPSEKMQKAELPVKKGFNVAYRTLKTPHITEKAGDLAKKNQYVFKIWPGANKTEIKKAIQDIYGVDVLDIRIIKISRKPRRLGRQRGWREGYKKAIIKIKEGQKMEILPR